MTDCTCRSRPLSRKHPCFDGCKELGKIETSSSYPYLSIARQYGVPHGVVLLISDAIEGMFREYWHDWAFDQAEFLLGGTDSLPEMHRDIRSQNAAQDCIRRGRS